MKVRSILGFLVFSSILLEAQKPNEVPLVESFHAQKFQGPVHIFSQTPISAVVIKSVKAGKFTATEPSGNEILIPQDHDAPLYTYFLSFSSNLKEITISSETDVGFDYYLIHSGKPASPTKNGRIANINECSEELPAVDQSFWRAGLPEPSFSPSFHSVRHNIVHHSAGSNSNTNYTQVVRDIYLYHTEVNGWSDIGYNYLIAQDGTLFAGRDPGNGSQDHVRGAHFCGANTGTLGICLLGNYETATISDPALTTLQSLLTYQLLNQELSPFDTYSHPLGQIGTLAGHRDGCATLCPGENVYNMMETLKVEVIEEIESCNGIVKPITFQVDTTLVKVNDLVSFQAFGDYQSFDWIFEGGFPETYSGNEASVTYSAPGLYDVTLIGRRGIASDTVFSEELMKASYLSETPLIYPNPVSSEQLLKIDLGAEIDLISLYDSKGLLVAQWEDEIIAIPQLFKGMYFLTISAESRIYKEKLLIR